MSRKSVYILHTGGTIGCSVTPDGFKPVRGYLESYLQKLSTLNNPSMPAIHFKEYSPLLDSSNISPKDWFNIAKEILQNYDDYDGFVILHGTDTMAYTTSALSFMLQDLHKPVIITGSQVPIGELRTDGHDNLITALIIAANENIPEVCLYFHNRLYRGNRVQKVDANGFEAFDSPNYPPLAKIGTHIHIDYNLILHSPKKPFSIQEITKPLVASIHLFPGINAEIMEHFLTPPVQGLILQTYGVGNAPSLNKALLKVLEQACQRNVIIINCTQCFKGTVNMSTYATGRILQDIGVINGFDMTTEAALTKLCYLFSAQLTIDKIKTQMQKNLRGELTPA